MAEKLMGIFLLFAQGAYGETDPVAERVKPAKKALSLQKAWENRLSETQGGAAGSVSGMPSIPSAGQGIPSNMPESIAPSPALASVSAPSPAAVPSNHAQPPSPTAASRPQQTPSRVPPPSAPPQAPVASVSTTMPAAVSSTPTSVQTPSTVPPRPPQSPAASPTREEGPRPTAGPASPPPAPAPKAGAQEAAVPASRPSPAAVPRPTPAPAVGETKRRDLTPAEREEYWAKRRKLPDPPPDILERGKDSPEYQQWKRQVYEPALEGFNDWGNSKGYSPYRGCR